jgi:hypothetical protein
MCWPANFLNYGAPGAKKNFAGKEGKFPFPCFIGEIKWGIICMLITGE